MSYRYVLHRRLVGFVEYRQSFTMVVCMLNPSTADAHRGDPTIRRVKQLAAAAGAHHLKVVNLFAARSTNPKNLRDIADPVGPKNDIMIRHSSPGG